MNSSHYFFAFHKALHYLAGQDVMWEARRLHVTYSSRGNGKEISEMIGAGMTSVVDAAIK